MEGLSAHDMLRVKLYKGQLFVPLNCIKSALSLPDRSPRKPVNFSPMARATNKNRIYMAFYHRPTHNNFHVALLVTPRDIDSESEDSLCLHVMNTPSRLTDDPDEEAVVRWNYRPQSVCSRTGRLGALVFLGKTVMSADDLKDMLVSVPIVQGDSSWTCKSWTFSAIQASGSNLRMLLF